MVALNFQIQFTRRTGIVAGDDDCSQMTIDTIVHKSLMKMSTHPIDLEQRVSDFAARVIGVCEKLPGRKGLDGKTLHLIGL